MSGTNFHLHIRSEAARRNTSAWLVLVVHVTLSVLLWLLSISAGCCSWSWRGEVLEQRQVAFFVIILTLALISFQVLKAILPA